MSNSFAQLKALFPTPALQLGEVQSIADGVAVVLLQEGYTIQARGVASTGDKVFVRAGVIESIAPDLPVETAEI